MADPKALEILRRGAKAWNAWRVQRLDDRVDLTDTDLQAFSFRGYHLHSVDFSRSNLAKADLAYCSFAGSRFIGVIAPGVVLASSSGYDLVFENCDLTFAELTFVQFRDMEFRYCNLRNAFLYHSSFAQTQFKAVSLNDAN